jgi:hypothetical protein
VSGSDAAPTALTNLDKGPVLDVDEQAGDVPAQKLREEVPVHPHQAMQYLKGMYSSLTVGLCATGIFRLLRRSA